MVIEENWLGYCLKLLEADESCCWLTTGIWWNLILWNFSSAINVNCFLSNECLHHPVLQPRYCRVVLPHVYLHVGSFSNWSIIKGSLEAFGSIRSLIDVWFHCVTALMIGNGDDQSLFDSRESLVNFTLNFCRAWMLRCQFDKLFVTEWRLTDNQWACWMGLEEFWWTVTLGISCGLNEGQLLVSC